MAMCSGFYINNNKTDFLRLKESHMQASLRLSLHKCETFLIMSDPLVDSVCLKKQREKAYSFELQSKPSKVDMA